MATKERRIAKVRCSFELLSLVFSGGIGCQPGRQIDTNAPSDLKVVDIQKDSNRRAWLYCESESFELVEEGMEIPELKPFTWTVTE